MLRTPLIKFAAIFAAVVLYAGVAWAQSGKYRHSLTIYDDRQGNPLSGPAGIACSGDRVLVADSGNSRLLLYTFEDEELKLDTEIKLLREVRPTTVQIAAVGNLLAYDSKAKEILRFDPSGKASGKVQPRNIPDGSRIITKSFRVDASGNIYLLDVFGRRVVVLDQAGAFTRQIDYPEEFGFISDLSVGRRGNVFILDSIRSQVFAAEPGAARFTSLSGQLKDVLVFPTHVEVDSRGLLYLVDEESDSVGILRRDGSFIGKQFNSGRKEGLLYYPSQLCVGDGARIIIADRDNNRVQVFKEKE